MLIEVKICENCNHRNSVIAVECEKCGYDLTFAFPQKVDDSSSVADTNINDSLDVNNECNMSCGEWIIVSLSNEELSIAIDNEISLGRDCEPFNSKFNESNYTSRIHAKLRVFNGVVQVMDASTNGTFVNDKKINKMEWVDVGDGSIIKFADVSFVIRRR